VSKMGETEEHKYLKKVGMAILLNKGCNPVGTEITLPVYIGGNEHKLWKNFEDNTHHITDVAGITSHSIPHETPSYIAQTRSVRTLYCIEVKVSRSDFRNGFCMRGWGKMWLISPPGVIPKSEIPPGVGHYECDIENRTLKQVRNAGFSGYKVDDYIQKKAIDEILWSGYVDGVKQTFLNNPEINNMFGGKQTHFFIKGKNKGDLDG